MTACTQSICWIRSICEFNSYSSTKYERQESPDSSISGAERESESQSRMNLCSNDTTPPDDIIELKSNPLHWTQDDVYQYLIKTEDCSQVAQKCKDEVSNFSFF